MNLYSSHFCCWIGGEKKIVKELDTKVVNAAIFIINNEDHTLRNMTRKSQCAICRVQTTTYFIQHKFELRVQTTSHVYTPQDAFTISLTDLLDELSLFEERLKDSLRQKKDEGFDD